MEKSIEEKVEDIIKEFLRKNNLQYFTKNESVNSEIDAALEKAPTKQGGNGKNRPDIRLFLGGKIPVMIEVKGKRGDFQKLDKQGEIENADAEGTPIYKNIQKYAVNGAVHYANAIIDYTKTYKSVIAIGVNGYELNGQTKLEIGAYYVSLDNLKKPKKISEYSDFSFLLKKNRRELSEKISQINLSEEERENAAQALELAFENSLLKLNQKMYNEQRIAVDQRISLLVGMIMAGLGIDEGGVKVEPLEISELKGQNAKKSTDGDIIMGKIESFLSVKNLPDDKKDMILRDLKNAFISSDLWKRIENGESILKKLYIDVKEGILPILKYKDQHLDYAGKIFKDITRWTNIANDSQNDVVLTPRYVTEFMAKLAGVNKDSYVWDYAAGSGGFLVSSMKLMIQDAVDSIKSPDARESKINAIKSRQLLGIEIRGDIYLLSVLNMILMGDGSSNILHEDSLNYDGNYGQGDMRGQPFPANVFLLNPPYSQKGKGFNFVEKAFSKMKNGRGVVLIQENAGSGNGLPYTKKLLEKNSLAASIRMADIFCGKAGVQTAVYVFDVGIPHDKNKLVKFIDFSEDGYTRQNRKKSGESVNLRDTGNAKARYKEVVDIVLGNKKSTNYFAACVIEDTISLNGDDWTYSQHKKIDTVPTEADFKKTVKDYLSWKVSTIIREETPNFQ